MGNIDRAEDPLMDMKGVGKKDTEIVAHPFTDLLNNKARYTRKSIGKPNVHERSSERDSHIYSLLPGRFILESGNPETDVIKSPNTHFGIEKMQEYLTKDQQELTKTFLGGEPQAKENMKERLRRTGVFYAADVGHLGKINQIFGEEVGNIVLLNWQSLAVESGMHIDIERVNEFGVTGDEFGGTVWKRVPEVIEYKDSQILRPILSEPDTTPLSDKIAKMKNLLTIRQHTNGDEDYMNPLLHFEGLVRDGALPKEILDQDPETGEFLYLKLKINIMPLAKISAPPYPESMRDTELIEYLYKETQDNDKDGQIVKTPYKDVTDALINLGKRNETPELTQRIANENANLPSYYRNLLQKSQAEGVETPERINHLINDAFFDNRYVRGEIHTHEGFFWQTMDILKNEEVNPEDPLQLFMIADRGMKKANEIDRARGNRLMENIAGLMVNAEIPPEKRSIMQLGGSYVGIMHRSDIEKINNQIAAQQRINFRLGEQTPHVVLSIDESIRLNFFHDKIKNDLVRDFDPQSPDLEQWQSEQIADLFKSVVEPHKEKQYREEKNDAWAELALYSIDSMLEFTAWVAERSIRRLPQIYDSALQGDPKAQEYFYVMLGIRIPEPTPQPPEQTDS